MASRSDREAWRMVGIVGVGTGGTKAMAKHGTWREGCFGVRKSIGRQLAFSKPVGMSWHFQKKHTTYNFVL